MVGGHWTKTLLSPRHSGKKPGQSLCTRCQWCLGARQSGWRAGGDLILATLPLTPRALTPKPCFSTRPPAKSLPQQLLARLEPSFLCECQALTLAHSGPNTNQNQQKPSCINPNCPPHAYTHTRNHARETTTTASTKNDRASHFHSDSLHQMHHQFFKTSKRDREGNERN